MLRKRRRTHVTGTNGVPIEPLEGRCLLSASLVDDFNTAARGSWPYSLTDVNGTLFCGAYDEARGLSLWKSDGTAGGTVAVKQLLPGASSVSFESASSAGGILYFRLTNYDEYQYLWRSDGTPEGTYSISSLSGDYGPITAFHGKGYWMYGGRLYATDGTAQGTQPVKTLGGSSATLDVVGDAMYLVVQGSTTDQLWKSDGTTVGTTLVEDVGTAGLARIRQFEAFGGAALFVASDSANHYWLCRTDGTASGTARMQLLYADSNPGLSPPRFTMTQSGGSLFVLTSRYDQTAGMFRALALWTSDGTASGTQLIDDLSSEGLSAYSQASIGDALVLQMEDASGATIIWRSDGTPAGTHPVVRLDETPASYLVPWDGRAWFLTQGLAGGGMLWSTDGTAAGTAGIPAPTPSSWTELISTGQRLYFTGEDAGHGFELWTSDGSPAGTRLTRDLVPGTEDSMGSLATLGGTLLFSANDGTSGGLWASDGTHAGKQWISDVYASPSKSVVVGGTLYFAGSQPDTHNELWNGDGTPEGTRLVKDINLTPSYFGGTDSSDPAGFVNVNGTVFFTADDGVHGRELWLTDGTTSGTHLVKDISTGGPFAKSSCIESPTSACGLLFFAASTDGSHYGLWKSDGTEQGTGLVMDMGYQFGYEYYDSPYIASDGNVVYYVVHPGQGGYQIWRTDGVHNEVVQRTGAPAYPNPQDLTMCGSTLYFTDNSQLWRCDGITATQVCNAYPLDLCSLFNVNGTLFFLANNASQLWCSDGTPAGTWMVRDFAPGYTYGSIGNFTAWGNILAFTASDPGHGTELWLTDGTPAGTHAVDTHPGPTSSNPANLTIFDGSLYFTADDGYAGTELWRLGPTQLTGADVADSFLLRADADGPYVRAYQTAPTTGWPDWMIGRGTFDTLSISAGNGDDTLTLDFANGSPLPSGTLTFDGGDGADTLALLGNAPADAIDAGPDQVQVNGSPIATANLETVTLGSDGPGTATLASLRIRAGAQVKLASGGKVLVLGHLQVDAGGVLDLGDGALVLRSDETHRDADFAAVAAAIRAGYHAGAWDGVGIVSSAAHADSRKGLAAIANLQADRAIQGVFLGQPVDENCILIRCTWNGDTDLDGKIDASDYLRTDYGLLTTQTTWRFGDFNHDGVITADDYGMLDAAYLAPSAPAPATAAPAKRRTAARRTNLALSTRRPAESARHRLTARLAQHAANLTP